MAQENDLADLQKISYKCANKFLSTELNWFMSDSFDINELLMKRSTIQ